MRARSVQVAVPVPGLPPLTYRVPAHLDIPKPGARVLVPIGTRKVTGWVIPASGAAAESRAPRAESRIPKAESREPRAVKDLLEILDPDPLLPREIVDLALWTADYYLAGPGEALAAAMPPQSAVFSRRVARLTESGAANELQVGLRKRALDLLREHGALPIDSLVRRLEGRSPSEARSAKDG